MRGTATASLTAGRTTAAIATTALVVLLSACTSGGTVIVSGGATTAASSTHRAPSPSGSRSASPSATTATGSALGRRLAARMTAAIIARPSVTVLPAGHSPSEGYMLIRFGPDGKETDSFVTVASTGPGEPGFTSVVVRGVTYIRMPQKVAGKHWVKMPSVATMMGTSGDVSSGDTFASTTGQGSPIGMIMAALQYGTVGSLGSQTLDGATVDVYRLRMTDAAMEAMLRANLPADVRSELGSATTDAADVTGMSVQMDVSLDAEGLPLRVVTHDPSDATSSQEVVVLRDWGKPVHITAPKASDTVDFTKLTPDQVTEALG